MSIDKLGQGPATKIDEGTDEYIKDQNGFTNPNLHRRVEEPSEVSDSEKEQGILDYKYNLGIYGFNSYRTTETITHSEVSDETEVP